MNKKENAEEENIFLQVAIKRGMQSKEASTDIVYKQKKRLTKSENKSD